jgi:putative DNA primase/helicase
MMGGPDELEMEPAELPAPNEPMKVAARLVSERYRSRAGTLLLRSWRGSWWAHSGTHWVEVEPSKVRAMAYAFTEHATYLDDTKKGPEVKPWAPNRYKVADLLDALAAVTHLDEDAHPPTWLDAPTGVPPARELVSTANGLLHVGTRRLMTHDPRLFNNVSVPFDYDPGADEPTRWHTFLDDLWPGDADSIAALQEFFGYVISGRTDLHKILLLIGPTRAGKGVLARVLKALVGRGNYAGPTLASLGTNFGLQPLIGKPLAIVSDARLGRQNVNQVVERLLSISGEDMLTIDRKYQEPWTGTLPTRFLVISNELPRFGDASGAIANRFVVLTLSQSWLGRENTGLTDELTGELPGILNWSLDGLERLQPRGRFTEPATSADAIVALQDLVSPVAAFVRDRCERGLYEIGCKVLYDEWKVWADDNGHRAGSVQTFGRDLRAVIPALKTSQPRDAGDRIRRYVGLRLNTAHNANDRVPTRSTPSARGGTRIYPLSRDARNSGHDEPLDDAESWAEWDEARHPVPDVESPPIDLHEEPDQLSDEFFADADPDVLRQFTR